MRRARPAPAPQRRRVLLPRLVVSTRAEAQASRSVDVLAASAHHLEGSAPVRHTVRSANARRLSRCGARRRSPSAPGASSGRRESFDDARARQAPAAAHIPETRNRTARIPCGKHRASPRGRRSRSSIRSPQTPSASHRHQPQDDISEDKTTHNDEHDRHDPDAVRARKHMGELCAIPRSDGQGCCEYSAKHQIELAVENISERRGDRDRKLNDLAQSDGNEYRQFIDMRIGTSTSGPPVPLIDDRKPVTAPTPSNARWTHYDVPDSLAFCASAAR